MNKIEKLNKEAAENLKIHDEIILLRNMSDALADKQLEISLRVKKRKEMMSDQHLGLMEGINLNFQNLLDENLISRCSLYLEEYKMKRDNLISQL